MEEEGKEEGRGGEEEDEYMSVVSALSDGFPKIFMDFLGFPRKKQMWL